MERMTLERFAATTSNMKSIRVTGKRIVKSGLTALPWLVPVTIALVFVAAVCGVHSAGKLLERGLVWWLQ